MIQITCKACRQPFGQMGDETQPRVIPCGHSICELCLNERISQQVIGLDCPVCFTRYDPLEIREPRFAPVNHLYYEMVTEMNDFIARKEWEKNGNKNDEDSQKQESIFTSIEYKCLYPFCHRLRFEKDGVKEIFCSAKCMDLNEQLYSEMEAQN